jgi:hypothetical protein
MLINEEKKFQTVLLIGVLYLLGQFSWLKTLEWVALINLALVIFKKEESASVMTRTWGWLAQR